METQPEIKVRDFALEQLPNQNQQTTAKQPGQPAITISQPASHTAQVTTTTVHTSSSHGSSNTTLTNTKTTETLDSTGNKKLKSPYSLPYSGIYLPEWTVTPGPTPSMNTSAGSGSNNVQDILASLTNGNPTTTTTGTHRASSAGSDYSRYSTPLTDRQLSSDSLRGPPPPQLPPPSTLPFPPPSYSQLPSPYSFGSGFGSVPESGSQFRRPSSIHGLYTNTSVTGAPPGPSPYMPYTPPHIAYTQQQQQHQLQQQLQQTHQRGTSARSTGSSNLAPVRENEYDS